MSELLDKEQAAQMDREIYELALQQPEGLDADLLKEALPKYPLEVAVNGVNRLLQLGRLEVMQVGSRILYRGVQASELERMSGLTGDERLVYKHIENSGNEGIWVRTLKQKTNLLQGVITRCLKGLEQKAMIKSVKSVKHPTRKLYMMIDVSPSSDITGGPWYTDQEMDTDFIEQLASQCFKFIYVHSYPRGMPNAVFSANHVAYPKSSVILRHIVDNGITNVVLSVGHVEELLNMLVYDGKIERLAPAFEMDMGSVGGGRSMGEKPKTDW
ncbi:34-kDa subunit of RNA polymerase III (C), partial [Coemansia furcata]